MQTNTNFIIPQQPKKPVDPLITKLKTYINTDKEFNKIFEIQNIIIQQIALQKQKIKISQILLSDIEQSKENNKLFISKLDLMNKEFQNEIFKNLYVQNNLYFSVIDKDIDNGNKTKKHKTPAPFHSLYSTGKNKMFIDKRIKSQEYYESYLTNIKTGKNYYTPNNELFDYLFYDLKTKFNDFNSKYLNNGFLESGLCNSAGKANLNLCNHIVNNDSVIKSYFSINHSLFEILDFIQHFPIGIIYNSDTDKISSSFMFYQYFDCVFDILFNKIFDITKENIKYRLINKYNISDDFIKFVFSKNFKDLDKNEIQENLYFYISTYEKLINQEIINLKDYILYSLVEFLKFNKNYINLKLNDIDYLGENDIKTFYFCTGSALDIEFKYLDVQHNPMDEKTVSLKEKIQKLNVDFNTLLMSDDKKTELLIDIIKEKFKYYTEINDKFSNFILRLNQEQDKKAFFKDFLIRENMSLSGKQENNKLCPIAEIMTFNKNILPFKPENSKEITKLEDLIKQMKEYILMINGLLVDEIKFIQYHSKDEKQDEIKEFIYRLIYILNNKYKGDKEQIKNDLVYYLVKFLKHLKDIHKTSKAQNGGAKEELSEFAKSIYDIIKDKEITKSNNDIIIGLSDYIKGITQDQDVSPDKINETLNSALTDKKGNIYWVGDDYYKLTPPEEEKYQKYLNLKKEKENLISQIQDSLNSSVSINNDKIIIGLLAKKNDILKLTDEINKMKKELDDILVSDDRKIKKREIKKRFNNSSKSKIEANINNLLLILQSLSDSDKYSTQHPRVQGLLNFFISRIQAYHESDKNNTKYLSILKSLEDYYMTGNYKSNRIGKSLNNNEIRMVDIQAPVNENLDNLISDMKVKNGDKFIVSRTHSMKDGEIYLLVDNYLNPNQERCVFVVGKNPKTGNIEKFEVNLMKSDIFKGNCDYIHLVLDETPRAFKGSDILNGYYRYNNPYYSRFNV